MTKQEKQYRQWVASAIIKARKSSTCKVAYIAVSPRLNQDLAFSYMQWSTAEGWLHTDGMHVYETRRTLNWPISEILHDINKGKYQNDEDRTS